MAMIAGGFNANERVLQAELLFHQAVTHCERGDWEAALSVVEKALELEKRVAFLERRALILERLCRLEDAMLARREATALAEQVRVSHLEEVLEFRSNDHQALEQLRLKAMSVSQIERGESQSDQAMICRVDESLQRERVLDHLIARPGPPVLLPGQATARPPSRGRAARRRAASQASAQRAKSSRVQKRNWLAQAWYALVRGLGLQR